MLVRPYLLRIQGSVIPSILPNVLLSTFYSFLVCYIHINYFNLYIKTSIIPSLSVVFGLLLVFKTNSCYDRFYEGRKLWSTLKTATRNLGRYVCIFIPNTKNEQATIEQCLNLIIAYCYVIRMNLAHRRILKSDARFNKLLPEDLLTSKQTRLEYDSTLPDERDQFYPKDLHNFISLRINQIIEHYKQLGVIDGQCNTMTNNIISIFTTVYANMERISTTPIPLAYKLHLNHCQWIYLLFLPFTLVGNTGMVTIIIQFVVSFTFFGINAIGDEIENPFGYDANDLPLDSICHEIITELTHYSHLAFYHDHQY